LLIGTDPKTIRNQKPVLREFEGSPVMIGFLLFILTLTLSIYDFRTRRVPNGLTLTLLTVGMGLHFPGQPEIWTGSAVLFTFWHLGVLGGGDAKLWMALLWLAPPDLAHPAFVVLFSSIIITALAQMLWRKLRGQVVTGVKTPGAWRTLPFVIWLAMVSGV
jgi:Flp pilus assembly protein protease CpaA